MAIASTNMTSAEITADLTTLQRNMQFNTPNLYITGAIGLISAFNSPLVFTQFTFNTVTSTLLVVTQNTTGIVWTIHGSGFDLSANPFLTGTRTSETFQFLADNVTLTSSPHMETGNFTFSVTDTDLVGASVQVVVNNFVATQSTVTDAGIVGVLQGAFSADGNGTSTAFSLTDGTKTLSMSGFSVVNNTVGPVGIVGPFFISAALSNNDTIASTSNTGIDFFGFSGNDSMQGGIGNDTLDGGDGNDTIDGGADNDSLSGGLGFDTIDGGQGDDILRGGDQADVLRGAEGNDSLYGGKGLDNLDGGLGNDFLYGLLGADILTGADGFDLLDGGDGDDNLNGGKNADTLVGGLGNDTLGGGQGLDMLDGGDGNDILKGALGTDTITGGLGADTFDLSAIAESLVGAALRDTITDFSTAQGDKINLLNIDANSTLINDQAFAAAILASGAFTAEGQLRLVGNILSGNTDSNFATSEFEIQLTGVTALTGADFIL